MAKLLKIGYSTGQTPVFCVAPVDALRSSFVVDCFSELANHLRVLGTLWGIHLGPRDDSNLIDLAHESIRSCRKIQPRGPLFLAGWCTGGLLAFEMASQLMRSGESVGILALMDSIPQYDQIESVNSKTLVVDFLKELTSGTLNYSNIDEDGPTEQDWVEILRELSCIRPEFADICYEVIAQLFKTFCSMKAISRKIIAEYEPKRYDGNITLIIPEDSGISSASLGWKRFGLVEAFSVPGSHRSMLSEPIVKLVAKVILEQASFKSCP